VISQTIMWGDTIAYQMFTQDSIIQHNAISTPWLRTKLIWDVQATKAYIPSSNRNKKSKLILGYLYLEWAAKSMECFCFCNNTISEIWSSLYPGRFPVLIYVKGRIDFRVTLWMELLNQLKNPMKSSVIETATRRAPCFIYIFKKCLGIFDMMYCP
jgi:hypothetical protein